MHQGRELVLVEIKVEVVLLEILIRICIFLKLISGGEL